MILDSLNNIVNPLDEAPNIPAAFFANVFNTPQATVYSQGILQSSDKFGPRNWSKATYQEVAKRILGVSNYLKSIGISKGSKVAILSASRPEWMESDLAILSTGAAVVSIYQSLPAQDIAYILYDSGADVVFAENQEQVGKLLELISRPISIVENEDRPGTVATVRIKKIITFEETTSHELIVKYSDLIADFDKNVGSKNCKDLLLELKLSGLTLCREDLACLVYTSGTTGPPKGVIQSHGNHLANCRQAWRARLVDEGFGILVLLPLAHSFAKLMGYLGFLSPATLCFPAIVDHKTSKLDAKALAIDMASCDVQIVPLVPRLLEKMQAGVVQQSQKLNLSGLFLKLTLWAAKRNADAISTQSRPNFIVQTCFQGTESIRKKIKLKLFGKGFGYAISGGAKLNPAVNQFFKNLEIEILEGYGLTETCVATNVNPRGKSKIGSVGPVLDQDILIKIEEDGEILYKGPNVTKGYFNRPTATKASWDQEGWFHTGDLGELDTDGYLHIVGRKKDLLVTSYGKNIAPDPIESKIKNSRFISQAVLVGDGRPFCTALLTLEIETVEQFFKQKNVILSNSFTEQKEILELINNEILQINGSLANFEAVKKFLILPEDFTIDNGFLTPTFKIKKKLVLEKYKSQIDKLYDNE